MAGVEHRGDHGSGGVIEVERVVSRGGTSTLGGQVRSTTAAITQNRE